MLVNFTFKVEFARVTVDFGYNIERIIKGGICNDFIRKTSGTNILAEIQDTR